MRPYRLHVFVPAIMSAGLIFSIITLVRDLFRNRRGIDKHARLAGQATAAAVLTEPVRATPSSADRVAGVRPRAFYGLVAAGSGAVAVGLFVAASLLYATADSSAGQLAWLLAAAALVAAVLMDGAFAAAVVFVRWPTPPSWVHPFLRESPLGATPSERTQPAERGPTPLLTAVTLATAAAFGLLVLAAAVEMDWLIRFDDVVGGDIRSWQPVPIIKEYAADLGRTHVALVVAVVVGVSTLKCRIFAAGWLLAVLTGLGLNTATRAIVDRPRPSGGAFDSFPSGHLVQVTLLALLLPLAIRVLVNYRLPGWLTGPVLGFGVAAVAFSRVQDGGHWPADVIGGVLLGTVLALSTRWIVAHEHWHSACTACPWRAPDARAESAEIWPVEQPSEAGAPPAALVHGALKLRPATARKVRWAARAWLLATLTGFAVLAIQIGIPVDPEGDTLASSVATPVQLGLLVVAAIGGLIALRWEAAGAAVIAVSAVGLGIFAAVQYEPAVALAVAVVFAVPAILFWLAWQHRRSLSAVFLVAAVTAFTLTAEGIAAGRIHDHFFGPATAESRTPGLVVDRVEWVWSGALTPDGVTVVAKLADGHETARLLVRGPAGRSEATGLVQANDDGLARMTISGLAASVDYTYLVEVDGRADGTRGRGAFTTAPRGPASFTVALASCARSASNAAVYDAIRAADPLLYLITGDMHYANIAVNDTEAFLGAYARALTAPAQAALYRSVPVDYVWDDHDYGPNDAGADSPSRAAARAAYRAAVPHPALVEGTGGAIYHAFTIGRVRFVVTDTRSARTAESMLGDAQERWLIGELSRADQYGLIVWVNPDPWIAAAEAGADHWGGFAEQRRRIADAIADRQVDNLVMLSGDAHMVALDDGTNSDYSTSGGAGFPVLHAAALDRPGRVKGGPYSAGAYPGAGQFGLLSVVDDGKTITVKLEGRDHTGRMLVNYETTR